VPEYAAIRIRAATAQGSGRRCNELGGRRHILPEMAGPVAYLITFTTYGTRLHGDERGTVDRRTNRFGAAVVPANAARRAAAKAVMRQPEVRLDYILRPLVERSIRETCIAKGWPLHAVHVRTNHVHLVVSALIEPESVLGTVKAWATRDLRNAGAIDEDRRLWTRHGSTRYLWNERAFEAACGYVIDLQGADLD
jgi:REP element-mobilizing transposase RayT